MANIARAAWKTSGLIRGVGIPAPTGQFTVGCVDLMQQMKEGEEDVFVRLFYPTATPAGQVNTEEYETWYPHKNYIKGALQFLKSSKTELKSFVYSLLLDPRIPALSGAPLYQLPPAVRSAVPHYPVVVFSHGLGSMRTDYCGICCDLASHGYVVAAVEHRDLSACMTLRRVPGPGGELVDEWVEHRHLIPNEKEFPLRNKQVLQRASEVSRALDLLTILNDGGEIHDKMGSSFDFSQFKGRLDVSRPAVMGHSFGGATTVQTLSNDTRFKCGIAMDTWMYPLHDDFYTNKGIEQPLLFINSFDFQWKENVQKMMKLVKPPNESGMSTCRMVTLIDSSHFNQCDVLFTVPSSSPGYALMKSKIDPYLAHAVNLDVCHSFLRRHQLQDPDYQQPIPNLDGTDGHSEHILFGTNVDLSDDDNSGSSGRGTPSHQTLAKL